MSKAAVEQGQHDKAYILADLYRSRRDNAINGAIREVAKAT